MQVGVDYYPEHWPEERWEKDAAMMEEVGIKLVRMAEFAWSKMEPVKGKFNFAWLDKVISILVEHGIKVILGTPTAAPPAWLIKENPSILPVDENGVRRAFGARRHYCPNNPAYRQDTRRIVQAMVDHFGDNHNISGWQIDNEFSGRCYCENCQQEFQHWLKDKYNSLENLNENWGTIFWSQTYQDWAEIPVPLRTTPGIIVGAQNPGLHLDYYRFISDSWVNYQKLQLDILRAQTSKQLITHNSMFRNYNGINYSLLNEELDFVSWDNYPMIFGQAEPVAVAAAHDLARGLKGTGFWVMEEQSGPAGWGALAATPEPGQLRLWSYQALAHGADTIVFFRWRTCRFGTEQYWHGILDHHGEAGWRYQEVKQFISELDRLGEEIVAEGVPAEAAVVKDYDIHWAFEIQPNSQQMDYEREINAYYKGLYEQNIMTDLITLRESFSKYKLLIIPNLYLLDQGIFERLSDFVKEGGVLVLSYRSGVKEASNNMVVNSKLPGRLKELVGAEVVDYSTLGSSPFGETGIETREETACELEFINTELAGMKGDLAVWVDKLKPVTAQVLARYCKGIFAGEPAITINNYAKGKVIYVGSSLSLPLHTKLAGFLASLAKLSSAQKTPAGVEAIYRGEKEILYLLNHRNSEVKFPLDNTYFDLLANKKVQEVMLEPYAVKLLKPL